MGLSKNYKEEYVKQLKKSIDIIKKSNRYDDIDYRSKILKTEINDSLIDKDIIYDFDMGKFIDEFKNFIKSASSSADVVKFAKKAKFVKGFNILANVGISSFLLAGVLPKTQYLFNKAVTGSYLDPGLRK
jgi:hypothetical protein